MSEGPADTTMAIQQTSQPHTYTELMQALDISQWSLHNHILMSDPLILTHQIPSQMVEHVGFQTHALCLPDQSSHFSIAKLLMCLTSNTARLQKNHTQPDNAASMCIAIFGPDSQPVPAQSTFFSCLNHWQKTVQVVKPSFEK